MSDILQPQNTETSSVQETGSLPPELADHGFTIQNLEILSYLDMKDAMFDSGVMDKVTELSKLLGDRNIQDLDIMLGNPYNLSKLDKIYTYLKLDSQTRELQAKEALLEREKNKYQI